MRKNKFARCKTREAVLWDLRRIDPPLIGVEVDDALARIAELTPPAPLTVDEGARKRALDILNRCDWIASPKVLDEIIDALGYIVEPVAPLTVDEERREKAVGIVFGAMLDGKKRGPDFLAANRWLDRITNSLGITVADPESATVADAPVVYPCAVETDDEAECCEGRDPWAVCANCLNAASGGDDEPARAVEAVEVGLDALKSLSALSSWWFEEWTSYDRTVSVDVNGTKATFDRDGAGNARVVIWGGGAL